MSQAPCQRACAALFERAHGELAPLAAELVDRHLDSCEACRKQYEALLQTLDAATRAPPRPTPAQRDRMLAAVLERVASPSAGALKPQAVPTPQAVPRPQAARQPWTRASVGVAMAALLAAAALLVWRYAPTAPPAPASPAATEAVATAPRWTTQWPTPGLRVAADDGAEWRFNPSSAGPELTLFAGTLRVQFHRAPEDPGLVVHSPGATTRVIGTVFYVSVVDPGSSEVGVNEGRVAVTDAQGREHFVAAGERLLAAAGLAPLDPATRQALSAWRLDLPGTPHAKAVPSAREPRLTPRPDAGEQRRPVATVELARVAQPPESPPPGALDPAARHPRPRPQGASAPGLTPEPVPPQPPATPPHEPGTPEAVDPYAESDGLMAQGRFSEAARSLEHLLERSAGTRASVHLDLARLYATRLGDIPRAIEHLRVFLERFPLSSAAPVARRELCRLQRAVGRPASPECGEP